MDAVGHVCDKHKGPTPDKGTWPEHCEQRAFVQGAKWWEFTKEGATMWGADADRAEAEAIRRYGSPSGDATVTDALTGDDLMDAFQDAHDRAINRQLGTTEATRQGVLAAVACFSRSLSAGQRPSATCGTYGCVLHPDHGGACVNQYGVELGDAVTARVPSATPATPDTETPA